MVHAQDSTVVTSGSSSLGHMPSSRWAFDESVTSVFEDMLYRSIPQLGAMRQTVFHVAAPFVQPGSHIVDLGCSLGDSLRPFMERFGNQNQYVGVESSESMFVACRRRFADDIANVPIDIQRGDLRRYYPAVDASVTLCVLTLMFIPIEHRYQVLADVLRTTRKSGVLILVEKLLGTDARTNALWTSLYEGHKEQMGYTRDEIERKRCSLEGVLVPVTSAANEQLLRGSGFGTVECFWRCLNFAGWLAIKE